MSIKRERERKIKTNSKEICSISSLFFYKKEFLLNQNQEFNFDDGEKNGVLLHFQLLLS